MATTICMPVPTTCAGCHTPCQTALHWATLEEVHRPDTSHRGGEGREPRARSPGTFTGLTQERLPPPPRSLFQTPHANKKRRLLPVKPTCATSPSHHSP